MILLDGKKLSEKIFEDIKDQVSKKAKKPRLAIVVVGENAVVEKFIAQKKKAAKLIGADLRMYQFAGDITTNELRKRIAKIVHETKNSGVIIQLPLPPQVSAQYILNAVTPEKDVDMLSARSIGNFAVGKSEIMPPVVGAVKAFFEEYMIDYKNKRILLLGAGALVGRPLALWFIEEKITFDVVQKTEAHPEKFIREADIIISGAGVPKLITGEKVKEGVVVIDAGTSESGGELVGDVDFESVSPKASYITPVPGGIGPVTVAVLFKNLLGLAK